jgi:hypothetical protein
LSLKLSTSLDNLSTCFLFFFRSDKSCLAKPLTALVYILFPRFTTLAILSALSKITPCTELLPVSLRLSSSAILLEDFLCEM